MKQGKGVLLYRKAKKIIPGGTQLLSKRPEIFLPDNWPAYYKKCKGIRVWDLDNKEYLDFSISGVGACTLGYSDSDVDAAVKKAIKWGNMCTLNAPEEIELAKLLCNIHPWADMVRYARTGGEAMSVAIRIARAYTGKEKIIFCGYHGWHDWYISANLAQSSALDGQLLPGLEPAGVPRGLIGTAIPFKYNDLESFKTLIKKFDGEIAGVVMEPVRSFWPDHDFLQGIRSITKQKNIPLVFDEVTSGLRMNSGGIHLKLGINPDIAVFAKALGNGYPMAAIIGKAKIMSSAQSTFISSTYWTDRIGPCAALATLRKHKQLKVGDHLVKIGNLVQEGWKKFGEEYGLKIHITGIPPLSHWEIVCPDSQLVHTVIVKEMLKRGFLTSKTFYPTYAHKISDTHKYLTSLDEVLKRLAPYIKDSNIRKIYAGPVAHYGFKRLT
jgi:glutamate-1-semialdehyde aminotransferase